MSSLAHPPLSLIVAHADRGVIGRDNQLPWHLPEDLKRFKQLTMGHHLIMGRKTYESLGRLLPGRTTVIVSRDPTYHVPGAKTAQTFSAALAQCADDSEPFLIGGAQMYALGLAHVNTCYITRVHTQVEGDAFFPALDLAQWQLVTDEAHVSATGLVYHDLVYTRLSSKRL